MNIIIASNIVSEYSHTLELIADKKRIIISFSFRLNDINVLVPNAAHKAYRGSGNFFSNINEALNHYNSPVTKALINAANDIYLKSIES